MRYLQKELNANVEIEFDRNRVQEKLEKIIDPNYSPTEEDKNKRKAFVSKAETYKLQNSDEAVLLTLLQEDSKDYLYNGLLSFCEAINELSRGSFSWPAVELYYCIYYLCRYKLHKNSYGIFRANGIMFYIDVKTNNTIEFIDKDKKSITTHDGTIKIFCKLLKSSSVISNSIDGKQSLEWLKEVREIVNYRAVRFYEPSYLNVFEKFSTKELLIKNIQLIEKDDSYVFQSEFAVIGLPIYFIREIKRDGADFKNLLTEERIKHLKSLINNELKELVINRILELE